jgi:hypothetical protein
VRIEDLLVGTFITLVVGLLLWPARRATRIRTLGGGPLPQPGPYLEHAFDSVLGFEPACPTEQDRHIVVRSRDRADEAFDTFLNERVGAHFDEETAAVLLSTANQAVLGGDLLKLISGVMGYQARTCAEAAREVRGQGAVARLMVRERTDQFCRPIQS